MCATRNQKKKFNDRRMVKIFIDDIIQSCKKRINPKKACGEDCVHPSSIQKFYKSNTSNAVALTEDAITRPNALSGRLTPIEKKDGNKRPIQVLNQVRVQIEKVLANRLDIDRRLKNIDEIYGFVKGKSTRNAQEALIKIIESRNDETWVLFLDFSKAYNHCLIHKLNEIIQKPLRKQQEKVEIVKQILTQDNIKIGGKFYLVSNGTPRGSPLSPGLFNLYMDELISEIKKECPGIQTVCHADDLVIAGQFEMELVRKVYADINLHINESKSQTFYKTRRGIPCRKTSKYLGCSFNSEGNIRGITVMTNIWRTKAKTIGERFGRFTQRRRG